MSTPPLLQLAEGRKPRVLHRRAAPTPREIALHMSVAKTLRDYARDEWKWTHFPSGEKRDKRVAGKLKSMGLQRGWPDFVLLSPAGLFHALELKRVGNDLSDDQEQFRTWAISHGVPFCRAETIGEVLVALNAWDVLRIKIGGAA